MGGFGSGRNLGVAAKRTTGEYLSIDVRRWKREGFLKPHQIFGWQWCTQDGKIAASIKVYTLPDQVILSYRWCKPGEEWREERYPILLDWTECNLGGKRPWFLCPGCGRRVAILYVDSLFQCRQCLQLAYQSQREGHLDRLLRRRDKIRKKLGWKEEVEYRKPKGMHRKTYQRLVREYEDTDAALVWGLAEKLNLD